MDVRLLTVTPKTWINSGQKQVAASILSSTANETTSTPTMKVVSSNNSSSLMPLAPGLTIPLRVLMVETDGSQTSQTIRIPRSMVAGARDRPIILTVTPKTGVNRGQKQVVVMTRNSRTGQISCHVQPPTSYQVESSASKHSILLKLLEGIGNKSLLSKKKQKIKEIQPNH